MFDFFKVIRSLYTNDQFCDVRIEKIGSTGIGGSTGSEFVQCHSIVLCSALPKLKPIFQSGQCDEDGIFHLVIIDSSDDTTSSLLNTVDAIYDALSGQSQPAQENWSQTFFGVLQNVEHQSIESPKKRIRTKTIRFFQIDEEDSSNVAQDVPPKRPKRICNPKAYLLKDEVVSHKDGTNKRGKRLKTSKHEQLTNKRGSEKRLELKDSVNNGDVSDEKKNSVKNEPSSDTKENDFPEEFLDIVMKSENLDNLGLEIAVEFGDIGSVESQAATSGQEENQNPIQKSSKIKTQKKKSRRNFKRGQCPECLEIFPSANSTERRQFVVHKLSHFHCDCPNVKFTSATAFRTHMTSVHSDKKNLSLSCSYGKCHALFFSQGALDHHVRLRHSNSLENGVGRICDECGQTFVNRHHLNIHTRHRHAQIKCPLCNEICIGKLNYNKHREKVHTMPELCDYCGKSFPSKKFLRIHVINLHLGDSDRPNRCEICGKGFLSKILLRDHVAVIHNHKKPYECRAQGCDRAFTTSACRRRHELRVHQLNISLKRGAVSKYVIPEAKRKTDEEATEHS